MDKTTILIKEKLQKIEITNEIKILYACESGSRAWGFPSPNSDFDVRFIYIHPKNWYLSVFDQSDVIEVPIENEFDLSGWELKKTLRLISKSNCIVNEWLKSPAVYKNEDSFQNHLLLVSESYYSFTSGYFHYISLAKKIQDNLGNNKKFKLKKLFYILRALLAAQWICLFRTTPPMELACMMKKLPIKHSTVKEIDDLIELKSQANENYEINLSQSMDDFIKITFDKCNIESKSFLSNKKSMESLEQFFLRVIERWM